MAAQQHSIPDTALSENLINMERSPSADFAEDYEAWGRALQDIAATAGPQVPQHRAAAGVTSVQSITLHLSSQQTVLVQQAHGSSMVLLAGLGPLQPNSSVFLCGVSGQLCDVLLQQTQGGLVATVSAAIALQPAQSAPAQPQPVPAGPLQAAQAQEAAAQEAAVQPDATQTAHAQPEQAQPQSAQVAPEPAGPVHPPDHVQAEYMLDVPALVAPV